MTRINTLKNQISDKLLQLNYIDEKKPLSLLRGPDIRNSFDEFQYWVFDFGCEFKNNVPVPVIEKKADKNPGSEKMPG